MRFIFGICILFLVATCSYKNPEHPTSVQAPTVMCVYPSADTLPENLLRFYVQFSESMKAVDNLEHIHLLDASGKTIPGALFNHVYELWDSQQTQLTLILDPARVKTGLKAHESLGRALSPGHYYQLIISQAENVKGQPLAQPFVKKFYVTRQDTVMPKVSSWKILPPAAQSKEALRLQFPQNLDWMSLHQRIRVLQDNQSPVPGRIAILQQEQGWQFTPRQAWKKGTYTLQVNSRLEDPAGNNLLGLFDHPLGSLKGKQEGELIELKIQVR